MIIHNDINSIALNLNNHAPTFLEFEETWNARKCSDWVYNYRYVIPTMLSNTCVQVYKCKFIKHRDRMRFLWPSLLTNSHLWTMWYNNQRNTWKRCMNCIYELYVWTVCMNCMYELYVWTVCMPCMYEIYVWHVCMKCIYEMYIWNVGMKCIYEMYIWNVYMKCRYKMYIWNVYMKCMYEMYVWNVCMKCMYEM